jgi:hypothetical protein
MTETAPRQSPSTLSYLIAISRSPGSSKRRRTPNALLAKGGVDTVVNGLIRGHDPVPKGTVIDPQEVRERLLIGDGQTSQKFMERLARACAVPLKADGVTGYRTKVRSIDTGKQIAAFLIPGEHVSIWLEFDESGWTESSYLPVLKKALEKAAAP